MFQKILKKELCQDRVRCKLCKNNIKILAAGYIHWNHALEHLYTHLQKKVYQCKLCSHKTSWKHSIKQHLTTKHGRLGTANNFRDMTQNYFEEIVAKFHECFNSDQESVVKSKSPGKNETEKRNRRISASVQADKSKNEVRNKNATGQNQETLAVLGSEEIVFFYILHCDFICTSKCEATATVSTSTSKWHVFLAPKNVTSSKSSVFLMK